MKKKRILDIWYEVHGHTEKMRERESEHNCVQKCTVTQANWWMLYVCFFEVQYGLCCFSPLAMARCECIHMYVGMMKSGKMRCAAAIQQYTACCFSSAPVENNVDTVWLALTTNQQHTHTHIRPLCHVYLSVLWYKNAFDVECCFFPSVSCSATSNVWIIAARCWRVCI